MGKNFEYDFFDDTFLLTDFVIQDFTIDNVVHIEPLTLAMFCIYQNLQVVLPRINVFEAGG